MFGGDDVLLWNGRGGDFGGVRSLAGGEPGDVNSGELFVEVEAGGDGGSDLCSIAEQQTCSVDGGTRVSSQSLWRLLVG